MFSRLVARAHDLEGREELRTPGRPLDVPDEWESEPLFQVLDTALTGRLQVHGQTGSSDSLPSLPGKRVRAPEAVSLHKLEPVIIDVDAETPELKRPLELDDGTQLGVEIFEVSARYSDCDEEEDTLQN